MATRLSHDLYILAYPGDKGELFALRLDVVRVLHSNVGERRLVVLQVLGQLLNAWGSPAGQRGVTRCRRRVKYLLLL